MTKSNMVSLIGDDKDEPPGIVGALSSIDLSFSDAESDGDPGGKPLSGFGWEKVASTVPPFPAKEASLGVKTGDFEVDLQGVDVDQQKDQDMTDASIGQKSMDTYSFGSMMDEEEDFVLLQKPFDMDLFLHSIQQGSRILDQIEGKEVVLVVGKTGTGKSTLIQALVGKLMFERVHETRDSDGTVYQKSVFDAKDPLPGFAIGHEKTSETRHMNCHPFQYDGNAFFLIDSPGFEDTEGQEVDIATSAMLTQIAKRCRSLRFVVLVNYASLVEDRGGAVRSILKLVRSFVGDFKTAKRSFLFLFTHLSSMGIRLQEQGKMLLQQEITSIRNGTQSDESALVVLDFIRACLKKSYPFVGIFHPIDSNREQLAHSICQLDSTDASHLAKNCDLTPTAKLTLVGELEKISLNLEAQLHGPNPDMAQANSIVSVFSSFEKYLPLHEVRVVSEKVNKMFRTFLEGTKRKLLEEVDHGTSGQPPNALGIRQSWSRLKQSDGAFDGVVNLDALAGYIERKVSNLTSETLQRTAGDMRHGVRVLGILQLWCSLFPDLSSLYDRLHSHMEISVQCAIDVVDWNFEESQSKQIEDEGTLRELLSAIRCLHSIFHAPEASLKLSVASVEGKLIDSQGILLRTLECWSSVDDNSVRNSAVNGLSVKSLVDRLRLTETLHSELVGQGYFLALQGPTESAEKNLSAATSLFVEIVCAQTTQVEVLNPSEMMQKIKQMIEVYELLSSSGNPVFQDPLHRNQEALRATIAKVNKLANELVWRAETLRYDVMEELRQDKIRLAVLKAYLDLDNFLPPEESFVLRSWTSCIEAHARRANALCVKAEEIFTDKLQRDPSGSLLEVKSIDIELSNLTCLGELLDDPSLEKAAAKVQDFLSVYAENLVMRSDNKSSELMVAVELAQEDVLFEVTEQLSGAAEETNILLEMNLLNKTRLLQSQVTIRNVCESIKRRIIETVRTPFAYEEKERSLRSLSLLTKGCGGKHTLHLPDFDVAKLEVQEGIKRHAASIEDLISSTSEWDEVDDLIEKLKSAVVLDKFTNEEASSRLRTLEKVRAKKVDDVDTTLDELIDSQDFQGISAFLAPAASSKDQLVRKKFDKRIEMIKSSLKPTMQNVTDRFKNRRLYPEDINVLGRDVQILARANSELSKFLGGAFGLGKTLAKVKSNLNEEMQKTTQEIFAAVKRHDFARMESQTRHARSIRLHFAHYIRHGVLTQLDKAEREYAKAKESVAVCVKKFLKSKFRVSVTSELEALHCASQSRNPELPEFTTLLQEVKVELEDVLTNKLSELTEHVAKTKCFDDGIVVLDALDGHLHAGLRKFVPTNLVESVEKQLHTWRSDCRSEYFNLLGQQTSDEVVGILKARLEKLSLLKFGDGLFGWFDENLSYKNLCRKVESAAKEKLVEGKSAIVKREYELAQESITSLELMAKELQNHVPRLPEISEDLLLETKRAFVQVCSEIEKLLAHQDRRQDVKGVFQRYRSFVVTIPSATSSLDGKRHFSLANQLVFEALSNDIKLIKNWDESFDFVVVKKRVEQVRDFGGFVADYGSLLHEEVRRSDHFFEIDEWLSKIFSLAQEYFSAGRQLGYIEHFAVLGLPPSASHDDIKRAFRTKARKFHPDKQPNSGCDSSLFRRVKEASEQLDQVLSQGDTTEQPFDAFLKQIHIFLPKIVTECLTTQDYSRVGLVLDHVAELKVLDDLVEPAMDARETETVVKEEIRKNFLTIQGELRSKLAERNYKVVGQRLNDLDLIEAKLKYHPNLVSFSWKAAVFEEIRDEIESLGRKALNVLSSHATAISGMMDFRRYMITLGTILLELPLFKADTKLTMSNVLESCLQYDWGFSYLFEFGLSLQRTDESSSDEETLVAHVILTEFSHFKEVLTMVWNEETQQKPAEETVNEIKELHAGDACVEDHLLLLRRFNSFEAEYKTLLGKYLNPGADLDALVCSILTKAKRIQPLASKDDWSKTQSLIPSLLAGIFAVFTVLKSGVSYNRVMSTSEQGGLATKLLMKPHNIQVLTLLCMFGCGSPRSGNCLRNQLLQIRTGEGKSMILGAAAVVLGVLGFRVRCVCYSDYLSTRDYTLFADLFEKFKVADKVNYSKITTLSEETTASKGDLRTLTRNLVRGQLSKFDESKFIGEEKKNDDVVATTSTAASTGQRVSSHCGQEAKMHQIQPTADAQALCQPCHLFSDEPWVLLVDEVDVFFGSEFYGRTYNQVAQIEEPEITAIIQLIWQAAKTGRNRLVLTDIQKTQPYKLLLRKLEGFESLVDKEIASMLAHVHLIEEQPYFLDKAGGRIGYKVMDSICYDVTFGYRTMFAYLKEVDNGTFAIKDIEGRLVMNLSCGQFSYANLNPSWILGVSGTLSAMSEYEKQVLSRYGVDNYIFVPSVYGQSNFMFDRAGDGVMLERTESDYYYSIINNSLNAIKKKRAVVIFFRDNADLKAFTRSAFYGKLGRNKMILSEEMPDDKKAFVINKAATSGQITLSTAVFGRGTDFFCKDDRVQSNGGVHVIQAFLSEEISEEIQIQGRTARQGKKGSYQLILFAEHLHRVFGSSLDTIDAVPRKELYSFLCALRDKKREQHSLTMEKNLNEATVVDKETHVFFDALLSGKPNVAAPLFLKLYDSFQKKRLPPLLEVDVAFVIDITGSMEPYLDSCQSMLESLLRGGSSITKELRRKYPDMKFKLNAAAVGFRDIDDDPNLVFHESSFQNGSHFTDDMNKFCEDLKSICSAPSGGADIAEDHLGAIDRCVSWENDGDWEGRIKFLVFFTDAPAHGLVPDAALKLPNVDNYSVRHPRVATKRTEEELARSYREHPQNMRCQAVVCAPMVDTKLDFSHSMITETAKHVVFVLDESGSMQGSWPGVVVAYKDYLQRRRQSQNESDLISVVQFSDSARTTVSSVPLSQAPSSLSYGGGGTSFSPAADKGSSLARTTPPNLTPVIVFMSDGQARDSTNARDHFRSLNGEVIQRFKNDLELHIIGFGGGTDTHQLQEIASASKRGKVYSSSSAVQLASIFVNIAGGNDVGKVLQKEVGKRISDAVSNQLAIEYLSPSN